jgi:hypothetical protein
MAALYINESLLQVIFITFIVGCGCAWQAGRAIALTWRPAYVVVGAMLLMGFAVRFFHFALFEEVLFAPLSYLFETACLMVVALTAWRATRARQMVRQYYWLYESNGPLGWRPRQDEPAKAPADTKIAGDLG